jgi:hypothetical protein
MAYPAQFKRLMYAIAMMLAVVITTTRPAEAQTLTSGTLSGTVVDQQGGPIPGVTIGARHESTGTVYETVTGGDGYFEIANVRVGLYTVTAKLMGFKDETQSAVNVLLGEDKALEFMMVVGGLNENVTVVAPTNAVQTQGGTASNITNGVVEALPTIQRSFFDVARTSPWFNAQSFGNSGSAGISISVAGRNNRYNNIEIDGAVNNDLFGLAAQGTPGGQTNTQPISFDAIQEMQLVVAPYDVRQGGFSGGGINIVTKTGSNQISGTAYMFGQNQSLVGKIPGVATPANPSPADTAVGGFSSKQGGFSLGGPIVQNKAFFFGNLDLGRQTTPSGFSLDGSSGQEWNAGDLALAQQALSIVQSKYGFTPGGIGQYSRPTDSNKVFVRTDFNLSTNNRLMVRTNYVDGSQTVGTPSNTTYLLPDGFYQISDKTSSTVAELNTTLSNSMFNEARVTYQRERNVRGDQSGFSSFPYIRVDFPDSNNIRFGTENSSQANQLNQDIVEVNEDLTWLKGSHTITVGTHDEFFHFYNLFIQNLFGNYEFSSVANLQAGLAQAYSHNFSNTSNPLQPAEFSVRQYGVYAGDQWRAASNFTLTYGVRLDVPRFPDVPDNNPLAASEFGYRTNVVPAPTMWSPRVGFSWDLSGASEKHSQVRGGVGFFTGRTPYVWLSDQYGNTGVDFTSLSVPFGTSNMIPFVANPNSQPTNIGGAGKQTINVINPNYKYPEIVRGNIAYDRSLGFWGLVGVGEFVFSKNVEDVAYQNLNLAATGTLPDGRLTYTKVDPNLNSVILLTNTSGGGTWTGSYKIERPFKNGFYVSGSYLYNHATSVSDGQASVALTNWEDIYVSHDANNPPTTTSIYQVGHRVNLTASIPIALGPRVSSALSFYYNGQSGQPYSVIFSTDANGDTIGFNDIIYAPANANQVIVTNGTWAQLDAFLSSDPSTKNYRGQIPPRDSGTSPWTNELDLRYAVNVPTGGRTKVALTMDVFNFLNLLNQNWGWVYYPNFNGPTEISYGGIDKATGKEIFNIANIASPNFQGVNTRDDLRSRWQAQWGVRVSF